MRKLLLVLLAIPFAAEADPILAPCVNDAALDCVVAIEELVLDDGIYDVELVLDSYDATYNGDTPLFWGDVSGAAAAVSAITELLNSLANSPYGPFGSGSSFVDGILVPYMASGTNWITSACSRTSSQGINVWDASSCGTSSSNPNVGPNFYWAYTRFTPTAVPEPSTFALFGIGLLGIGLARRRRKV